MLPSEGWLFTNRDQVYTNSMLASIPKAVSAEVRYPAPGHSNRCILTRFDL
jgi:hypothetical protein